MDREYFKKVLLEVALPLVLVFGFELLYRDSLFQTTLMDVPEMQTKKKLKPLMTKISAMGGFHATFAVMVVAFNLMSKPAAFYLISGTMFVQFASETLKSLYNNPRPYWVSDIIHSD